MTGRRIPHRISRCLPVAAGMAALLLSVAASPPPPTAAVPPGVPPGPVARPASTAVPTPPRGIIAVVNGDVVTRGDVDNRRRLFALSTGLPITKDVLDRLAPQVTKQLVDERLRLQEIERRHILVSDKEIAGAIGEIEQRNGMASGMLRQKLASQGVEMRTLIDQIRVQLGWGRVLHEQLGDKAEIKPADIREQQEILKSQLGQPEMRLAEIFIPVDDPAREDDARRFAEAVIEQLRQGAPFAVVAAQFSQSQSALQGGDLGWLQSNQLDPEVAQIAGVMPVGAISNAIRVPGGFSIITLRARREIGNDPTTSLSVRQAFVPFSTPLNPNAPTDQQKQALDKAKAISASVRSCPAMEAANANLGNARPSDPGELRLDQIAPPQFRQLLAALPLDKASAPLVAPDGVMLVVVCSREEKNLGLPSDQEIRERLLSDRIELASRQLMRDLQRRATIDLRS